MLKDTQAYMAAKPSEKNLMLEATKGVFDGSKTVFVNADRATEIVEACLFLKENGVKSIVVVGGADAWAITDFLKKENISVVLSDVHGLPQRADEPTDLPYKMPALLKKAGVKFCLGYTSFHSSRNLPFFAGTAAAHGLTKEEALQAVTKDAAEILGVADKTGTLTQGLDANIVVSTGDLLDMRGNTVTHAFIQGRQTALTGKQQELNEKYRMKYGHGK
jgi:imidazolonepropionase-like amidohydrolase